MTEEMDNHNCVAQYRGVIYDSVIPDYMKPGLILYLLDGVIPGDFLQALLRNDFMGACKAADENNIGMLGEYGRLLYRLPTGCKGSEQAIVAWNALGGLKGSIKAWNDLRGRPVEANRKTKGTPP